MTNDLPQEWKNCVDESSLSVRFIVLFMAYQVLLGISGMQQSEGFVEVI